ncbi:MAG: DUF5658 family protein [Ruminococcus sp.]|nr:DUF5658 family protein [Ruminococcus sp.]
MRTVNNITDNNQNVNTFVEKNPKKISGFSFYQKIFFLYFLNLIDWLCTEALLGSGKFSEANPIMQPVISDFWQTLLIKGILPLILVLVCAIVFKFSDGEESFLTNFLLYSGIIIYLLVNLWHIINFVLLFFII